MPIELTGEYTTARIMTDDESLVEPNVREQIQSLLDHPAFTEPIRMMPDTHLGAGAPVGFTMPLADKIVPNIVGVDVGCGMAATNLGDRLPLTDHDREAEVRAAIPMGRSVHEYDEAPHLVDAFPFDRANEVFDQFNSAYESTFGRSIDPIEFEFTGYDGEYVKSLCDRVLRNQRQGIGHIIKSAGTLGGGNHFIEFNKATQSEDYWLVIHSGSRYLGKSVAEYWQQKANEYRSADSLRDAIPSEYSPYFKFDLETVGDAALHRWVTGGMGESHLKKDKIRADFTGKQIEETFDLLSRPTQLIEARNDSLDWLDGREADGYYVDMLFAQQYARWNRELMSDAVCDVLAIEPVDRFQSVHNYIDFRDLTIRKGATPAREGQRLVIPFNMAVGSIIADGRGNDQYNQSAPHGAGRVMSRGQAFDIISIEEFRAAMDGIYSESVVESVKDEAPMAYKPAAAIESALEPTAEVVDRLEVVHNLKAR